MSRLGLPRPMVDLVLEVGKLSDSLMRKVAVAMVAEARPGDSSRFPFTRPQKRLKKVILQEVG